MRVERKGENRMDILLSRAEINDIFGGYEYIDYEEEECRAKIHSIILTMIPNWLLPLDCKKIVIEVRPASTGCKITLTKVYDLNSKKEITVTMIFKNSENLISALNSLTKIESTKSALYSDGQKYALICGLPPFYKKEVLHISEYSKVSHKTIDAVKIEEYWMPLCESGAIEKLSVAFLK